MNITAYLPSSILRFLVIIIYSILNPHEGKRTKRNAAATLLT